MTPRVTFAVLGTLMALTAGCATTGARAPEPRLVASASRLVVEVEGRGTVDVGSVECKAAPCRLDWDKVADPVLVAEAAPGWRFDHWDAPESRESALANPGEPRVYRAVFRRAGTEISKR